MSTRKKDLKPRYSAAELFGHSLDALETAELRRLSAADAKEICPFESQAYGRIISCRKPGGVCSIRPYSPTDNGDTAVPVGVPATTCPSRFLENGEIFKWVGEVILKTKNPALVPELPFLMGDAGGSGDPDAVGKIDMVLVNDSVSPITWCALEMQAVYFSGTKMEIDREVWRAWSKTGLPFPRGKRRPDFRSSGPKRLMPQLQIKVPTITRWGKKMAVVVDSEFWGSLRNIKETGDLSNSDVAWFVVKLTKCDKSGHLVLARHSLHFTTLAHAVEGLTGGAPLPLEQFEKHLFAKLARL